MRRALLQIYGDIERRARATSDEHTWWPCRRGCDSCCRRLADVPQLRRAEWDLLAEGIASLPSGQREDVARRIGDLAAHEAAGTLPRHITCPLLDEEEGACLVYASRPAACRTYGFYVERGIGLHCDQITVAVEAHAEHKEQPVMWGNQEGVDGALARLGAGEEGAKSLTFWARSELPSSPSSAM